MNNFFETIKSIYKKDYIETNPSTTENLTLTKWFSFDKNNLSCLKYVFSFIFYLKPQNYLYMLWLNIPKQYKVPFLKKIIPKEQIEDSLLNRIQCVLGWSNRELILHKYIIEKMILKDKVYWSEHLGVNNA